jgi:hypothetical protein
MEPEALLFTGPTTAQVPTTLDTVGDGNAIAAASHANHRAFAVGDGRRLLPVRRYDLEERCGEDGEHTDREHNGEERGLEREREKGRGSERLFILSFFRSFLSLRVAINRPTSI